MPIHYNISPELYMAIYVCRGRITAEEIFATADLVLVDKRRQPGLITIIDLLSAVEDLYLEDLYEAIQRIDKAADDGFVPGPIVLISHSKGIHLLVDAINLLPSRVPFRMATFYGKDDAVAALGLMNERERITQLWQQCNSMFEHS